MKVDRAKLRRLAEITIEASPEDIPVRGNASATGEKEDRQCPYCYGTRIDPTPVSIDEEQPPCEECGGKGTIEVDLDEELATEIEERLERGDTWAWCQVGVTASYAGLTGSDFLGGCSYEDERNFVDSGGYYDDMMTEAIEELAREIERHVREVPEHARAFRAVQADAPRAACACCPEFPLFNESEPS